MCRLDIGGRIFRMYDLSSPLCLSPIIYVYLPDELIKVGIELEGGEAKKRSRKVVKA